MRDSTQQNKWEWQNKHGMDGYIDITIEIQI